MAYNPHRIKKQLMSDYALGVFRLLSIRPPLSGLLGGFKMKLLMVLMVAAAFVLTACDTAGVEESDTVETTTEETPATESTPEPAAP